jgi:hypothetical protein
VSGYAAAFFFPDGTFKSPEMAALHATAIQGGFSTPAIEAERMVADGGLGAIAARAWLARQDHPDEGRGQPASPGY